MVFLLPLILLALSAAHCRAGKAYEMIWDISIPSHKNLETVSAGITRNFTILCQRREHYDANNPGPYWIGLWELTKGQEKIVAQIHKMRNISASEENLIVKGNLGQNGKISYLSTTWPVVAGNTFGYYQCRCQTLSPSFETEVSEYLELEDRSDPEEALKELLNSTQEASQKCFNETSDGVQLRTLLEEVERQIDRLEEAPGTMDMSASSKMMNKAGAWFGGLYGLPMPEAGCPPFATTKPSYVIIYEESNNPTCFKRNYTTHLSKPLSEKQGAGCFAHLRFCESLGGNSNKTWPDGSYCINGRRNQACPRGFDMSLFDIDYEDTEPVFHFEHGGLVEVGMMAFCCKNKGAADEAIEMPDGKPFFLYRSGGKCQQVKNMEVTEEHMDIASETTDNQDMLNGTKSKPDIEFIRETKPTRVHLCYYERKV